MDESQKNNAIGRDALAKWESHLSKKWYHDDQHLIHTIRYLFANQFHVVHEELSQFADTIMNELESYVMENNKANNLPRIEAYDGIGQPLEKIIHHPSYVEAGNRIYGSRLLSHLSKPGGLLHCLSLFFLSSQTGEAGHHCPIACSAGLVRVLQKVDDFPHKAFYMDKLLGDSFETNFTGAQFLTEVQGGSDVGQNATYATLENSIWRIYGEKWFCSNANADLMFVTARFDKNTTGTKGLGLFLVPRVFDNKRNDYTFRRLKEKLGTRTMATAEINFHGAKAYAMGRPEDGFRLAMENVLHISRLFNAFCVVSMARRAYGIARVYAEYRIAFSKPIISYPLVKENLARIKTENTAMLSAIFYIAHLQDCYDLSLKEDSQKSLLLRALVNSQKYFTAKLSVEHIHHALDVLAGNGTIETFSSIPRLLRDAMVCENWEGTHNVLHMQMLKDIKKHAIDVLFVSFVRDEINQMEKSTPLKEMLSDALVIFEEELYAFHALSDALQSLKIQEIVHQMAALFCALCLGKEVIDQLKTSKTSSKQDCFLYFLSLYFNKKDKKVDQGYLDLITRITLW